MSRQRPTQNRMNAGRRPPSPGRRPPAMGRPPVRRPKGKAPFKKKMRSYYYSKSEDDFEEEYMRKALLRSILCTVVLTGFSVLLFFLRFQPPLLPKMFAIELSAIPEIFAAIAYGPIAGVLICLLKCAIHALVMPDYIVTDASAFVVEAVFVAFVGIFYSLRVFPINPRPDRTVGPYFRETTILLGGFLGLFVALPTHFLMTNYFLFPMFEKLYASADVTPQAIIKNYNVSLLAIRAHLPDTFGSLVPIVKEVWQGIVFVNLPVMAFKLLLITVLTALIYPFVSPFLHYRPAVIEPEEDLEEKINA